MDANWFFTVYPSRTSVSISVPAPDSPLLTSVSFRGMLSFRIVATSEETAEALRFQITTGLPKGAFSRLYREIPVSSNLLLRYDGQGRIKS